MATYKVLKTVAHNFGASFVSVMNYVGNDYAMCHLIRRTKLTGSRQLSVNLRTRVAGPIELLSPYLVQAIESYCNDFGRLVTTGGAAMDMIDAAELQVKIVPPVKGSTVRCVTAQHPCCFDHSYLFEPLLQNSNV